MDSSNTIAPDMTQGILQDLEKRVLGAEERMRLRLAEEATTIRKRLRDIEEEEAACKRARLDGSGSGSLPASALASASVSTTTSLSLESKGLLVKQPSVTEAIEATTTSAGASLGALLDDSRILLTGWKEEISFMMRSTVTSDFSKQRECDRLTHDALLSIFDAMLEAKGLPMGTHSLPHFSMMAFLMTALSIKAGGHIISSECDMHTREVVFIHVMTHGRRHVHSNPIGHAVKLAAAYIKAQRGSSRT